MYTLKPAKRTLALLVLGFLAAFGCGTPGKNLPVSEGTAIMTAGQIQEIKVQLHDFYFKPNRINVIVDVPVRLIVTNETIIVPHNFSLIAPGAGLDIVKDVGASRTVVIEFTPTRPGEYQFFCDKDKHMKKGMTGILVVRSRM
jgi:plastocyanin domain-containing protein